MFYSNTKHIIHKFKQERSVALKDDSFLRAFFPGVINVPDLKEVTKKFLTVHTKTPEAILNIVHADFCAMCTKEQIMDSVTAE